MKVIYPSETYISGQVAIFYTISRIWENKLSPRWASCNILDILNWNEQMLN